MSIYAASGKKMEQIASNGGWGQFGDWADGLSIEDYPAVVTLWEHGYYNRTADLKEQLSTALRETKPIKDVADIINNLLAFEPETTLIVISNGIALDDEKNDELDESEYS